MNITILGRGAWGTAVGGVALLSEIHGWEVWPLSSFTATALYVLLASPATRCRCRETQFVARGVPKIRFQPAMVSSVPWGSADTPAAA